MSLHARKRGVREGAPTQFVNHPHAIHTPFERDTCTHHSKGVYVGICIYIMEVQPLKAAMIHMHGSLLGQCSQPCMVHTHIVLEVDLCTRREPSLNLGRIVGLTSPDEQDVCEVVYDRSGRLHRHGALREEEKE